VFVGLTAGMGRLIVAQTGKAGTLAKLAALSDRYYMVTTKIMIATNVVTFITISVEAAEQLKKLEASGASPDEKQAARERLTQQLMLLGGITMMGIHGDIASYRQGRNLYFDPDFAARGVARGLLGNDELLARAARLGETSELRTLLKRTDLNKDIAYQLNAELSDALTAGRITDDSLKLVLGRLRGNATGKELEAALAELRKANRLVYADVLGDRGRIVLQDVRGKLRVRALLDYDDLFKRAKALGTGTTLKDTLARTDFDAALKAEIRSEVSTAMATGKVEGLPGIMGALKRAEGPLQARQVLAELQHANRVAETTLADQGQVILGAFKGTEYNVGGRKLTIDPVSEADTLYPGTDRRTHLDEVKNTVNGFRSKLANAPQQLENMRTWRAQDPGNRSVKVVIESEQEWTDLFRPLSRTEKNPLKSPLKQLSTNDIPLQIGGRELSPAQLDRLWAAVEKKARDLHMFPPGPDFFAKMPDLAAAEAFLGVKL
jgi:hypothetical protein